MNLRQLEAFREVMRTGSVSKAARNMNRTQPAISSLIAGLETEVGYKLFERRSGRLHPVPEAHFLLDRSSSILNDVSKLRQNMQAVGTQQKGHLNIACLPILGTFMIPRVMSAFAAERGDVTFKMVSQSSESVYERLASQQFDVGIAEATSHSPLVEESITSMNCLCVVPADSDLAHKSIITASDLAGRPMATFLPNHYIRRQVEDIFKQQRIELLVRFELQNAACQFAFVEDNLAWAVVSPLIQYFYKQTSERHAQVVFIPFAPIIDYQIAVLKPVHTPTTRLATAFAEALHQEVIRITRLEVSDSYCPSLNGL